MKKTPHDVERFAAGHPVIAGAGALAALQQLLEHEHAQRAAFVLGDENTLELAWPELVNHVPALAAARPLQVRSGEGSKQLDTCRAVWEHLAEQGADRHSLLLCLGGGVVTDLGGFVAATYMRGIACVHVPTTLMGMVDAAIGGKCAIDLAGVKNLVGLFAPPLATVVHPHFLRTLGKRELLNGVAEMIKHGLVRDAAHWKAVRRAPLHDLEALAPLIRSSAAIKAAVVEEDPREEGPRKLLNFGHTIGHALEAFALEDDRTALLHGEAVAIGMICEAWLSWRQGLLSREAYDLVQGHLQSLYKPYSFTADDHHRLIALMRNDKKNADGALRFTLLREIGQAVVDVPVTPAQVGEALDHYRLLARDAKRHHP